MRYDRRRDRKGNAAFTAITIITLLGFATLTVDIGHARKAKAELQNAVDAAAHAAIAEINYTDPGLVAAENAAISVAALNVADSSSVTLTSSDLTFGEYDWTNGTFTATSDSSLVNAVIVATQKTDVDAIFALASFGVDTLTAGASTMAVVPPGTPATEVSCYLPFAVPMCAITGEGIFEFTASSSNTDTAAWATLEDGTPSGAFVQEQLRGVNCEGAAVGESVSLNGGAIAAGVQEIRDRINLGDDIGTGEITTVGGHEYKAPDPWPTDQWSDQPTTAMTGSDIESGVFGDYGIAGPVMLITAGDTGEGGGIAGNGIDDFCDPSPPPYIQEYELSGFAFGMVYDAKATVSYMPFTIRVNTEFNFDDYATDGGGDNDFGLVFHEPPRVLPPP
jgi:Flp pilus assembly protein TadG